MAVVLPNGKQHFDTATGGPGVGYRLYTYIPGTSTPKATYTDSTGGTPNTNPVVMDARGDAAVYWSGAYDVVLKDAADATIWGPERLEETTGLSTFTAFVASLLASGGSALVGFIQAGAGAILRTVQAKLRETVSITDYGGAAGAGDNTAAMDAAEAYLATVGGGTIVIPYPGEWKMNWVCTTTNITVKGPGGKGEYDVNCIRPYNTASPAITFGDGSTEVRYCGLEFCHVSGTDATAGAVRTLVGNAPQAILVRGGTIDFQMNRCVVYNGVQNLAFVPTLSGASITGVVISRCHFRSDLAGQPTARNFYLARYEHSGTSPNLGYLTSTKFVNTRVNGPKNTDNAGDPTTAAPSGAGVAGGYALEAAQLGNVGIVVEVNDSYWDCSDGAGVKLTGSSGVVCNNFQLDPGGSGRVILETDQSSKNIARYVVGNLRHGGQKFTATSGTIDLPNEADTFAYRPLFQESYVIGPVRWTGAVDPYDSAGTAPRQDLATATGPLLTYLGTGDGLETTNGARTTRGMISEEITLNTGGLTTQSSATLLPTNSYIEAVVCRVTQAITGTTNWAVGDATIPSRFSPANATLALGTESVGLTHIDQTGTSGPRQTAGTTLRITCTGSNPSAGKIRVTVFYRQYRAPQS